jgi:hypothetical protein
MGWWWWPKESEFDDLVVDGCSVLSLSLSLSPLAARGRFMIAFIITHARSCGHGISYNDRHIHRHSTAQSQRGDQHFN